MMPPTTEVRRYPRARSTSSRSMPTNHLQQATSAMPASDIRRLRNQGPPPRRPALTLPPTSDVRLTATLSLRLLLK
ncbi:hypothetical protein NL676_003317 [Syzygium grande]|nr:hypothetical protein NL676_003317 [Syzygium grande]